MLVVGWFVVVGAGLTWRLAGPAWSLQVLFAGVACLVMGASGWLAAARRPPSTSSGVALIDLQAQRIAALDEQVREHMAAGHSLDRIATSTSWWEEESRGRA